jgi:hypothetical protein
MFILGLVLELLYFAVKHRHLILYFKAKIDAIRMFPMVVKKRRINLKRMKVGNKDLRVMMTPVFEREFLRNKLRKFVLG